MKWDIDEILEDIFGTKVMSGQRVTAYYPLHIVYTIKRNLYFERGWETQGLTQNIKISDKVSLCLQMFI